MLLQGMDTGGLLVNGMDTGSLLTSKHTGETVSIQVHAWFDM